jgi:transketolase
VLDHLAAAIPELLGGSADLTPSNNTKAEGMIEIKPGEYNGTYMHYGVREHGMAGAMNGIALHGGLIPIRRDIPCPFRIIAALPSAWLPSCRSGQCLS